MSEVFASPHLIARSGRRTFVAAALGFVAFSAVGAVAWKALNAVGQTQVETAAQSATQRVLELAAAQTPPAPEEIINVVYMPRPESAPRAAPEPVIAPEPVAAPAPEPSPLPEPVAVAEPIVVAAPEVDAPVLRTCLDDLRTFTNGRTILFNIGSAEVDPGKLPQLRLLGELAADCDNALIRVTGHSDSSGSDLVNLALSWDRADNTIAAIEAFGLSTEAFEALGFGARAPIAQGDDADDELNRRVEFRVYNRNEQNQ